MRISHRGCIASVSIVLLLGACSLEDELLDECGEQGLCTRSPYGFDGTVQLDGTSGVLKYTRLTTIGDPDNITRVYFLIHGDGNSDYASSTTDDRKQMATHLRAGEGAIVAYPVSQRADWPSFDGGKNGRVLLRMFRHLEKLTGNTQMRFEQFSLSGGGRVNHALMRLINESPDSDADVREFADNHVRGIHDGDSLCYSISDMRANYIEAIGRLPLARFCFIHNTSGKMSYVHSHHNTIAKTVGNQSYPYGGSLTLQDGRLRFWASATHWTAWKGQFEKVFFGTDWGDDETPAPAPPPAPAGTAWIGEACASGATCESQTCLSSYPGGVTFTEGMCTEACERLCPDQSGKPTTFCVTFDESKGVFSGSAGHCFSRCDTSVYAGSGCRQGYSCVKMPRHNEPKVTRNVCLPSQTASYVGQLPDAEGDLPNPE